MDKKSLDRMLELAGKPKAKESKPDLSRNNMYQINESMRSIAAREVNEVDDAGLDFNPARGDYNEYEHGTEEFNSDEVVRALYRAAEGDHDLHGLNLMADRIIQTSPDGITMADMLELLHEPAMSTVNYEDIKYALQGAGLMDFVEGAVTEAVAKIGCLKCDEVSTAAAWKKNHGSCPKCNNSTQGVAETVTPKTAQEQMREWSNSVYKQYDDRGTITDQPDGETVDLSLRRYLNARAMPVQIEESHTPGKLIAAYRSISEAAEAEKTQKFGVFMSGGSIGGSKHKDKPKKTFDTKEEAQTYAKRMNKQLSPGEKTYYKIKYSVKLIKATK